MGNIAVDCPLCKAQLVACGVPQVVIQLLLGYIEAYQRYIQTHTQTQTHTHPSYTPAHTQTHTQPPPLPVQAKAHSTYTSLTNTITNLLWTLTNIVRGTGDIMYVHQLSEQDIRAILSLYVCEDECVCSMVRWLFTILTSKDDMIFNRLMGMGLHTLCTQALCMYIPLDASGGDGGGVGSSMSTDSTTTTTLYNIDRDEEGLLAVIRCMGNICAGSATYAHATFTQNLCIPRLMICLDGDVFSKFVCKEALRTLSYVLHNTTLEMQMVYVQPHVAGKFVVNKCAYSEYMYETHFSPYHTPYIIHNTGFLRHFHYVMHSEDSELQEAYLIVLEGIHPTLTLCYYSSRVWELKGDMQSMCKLVVNAKVTSMICQIAVLQVGVVSHTHIHIRHKHTKTHINIHIQIHIFVRCGWAGCMQT
ncbi:hypothetical protein EON65_36865 [archaeon]|nr:MAG: hypothetical protein EON65_36865 [archaeon]